MTDADAGPASRQRCQPATSTAERGGLTLRAVRADDLDACATLLAGTHAVRCAVDAALPGTYRAVDAARQLLRSDASTAFGHDGADGVGCGVLAERDGAVQGYLLARIADAQPETFDGWALRGRSAVVSLAGCATTPDLAGDDRSRRDLLRRLYAAAAVRWLADGALSHYIRLPDVDPLALETFWSLGFGQDITSSIRDVTPLADIPIGADGTVAGTPWGVTLRRALPADAAALGAFGVAMLQHHVVAPALFPCADDSVRWGFREGAHYLDDPSHVGFVAEDTAGRLVGMVLLEPPTWAPHALTRAEDTCYLSDLTVDPAWRGRGLAQALFQQAVAWAQAGGYRSITLSYMASNLAASAFWTRLGFRRVDVRLARYLDPRLLDPDQRAQWMA